ncbi:Protein of unknown function (DUF1759) [Popillia japonica]|uniref:CCHC-type domain-containing protein n=1 Tax=Popillia japonica TaxID=7064 RepID=A0AAW1K1J3_POPJA
MTDIQDQIRKRGTLKAKLTLFQHYLDSAKQTLDSETDKEKIQICIHETQVRLEKVESLLGEFDEIQYEIESEIQYEIESKHENYDAQLKERENFETILYKSIAIAKQLITSNQDNLRNIDSNATTSHNSQGVATKQLITSNQDNLRNIDSNATTSHNSQGGTAAQVIHSIEFSAENYIIAWELLCQRYNNTTLLVNNHVQGLFSLPNLTKESSADLRILIDNIAKHLRSLEVLGQPITHWDTLIIYIISEWKEKQKPDILPTLDELTTFLRSRADLLETLEGTKTNTTKTKEQVTIGKRHTFSTTLAICALCKESHYIYNCEKFLTLAINERIDTVKRLKLCINCLKAGHIAKKCKSGKCKKCEAQHNTLLHIEKAQQQVSLSNQVLNEPSNVLISTVLVQIVDANGISQTRRAIFINSFGTNSRC